MTLLSIRQLGLSIGQKSILRDVSFDIGPGQIVAITGESGSGKSMTAFSIIGLLPKTAAAAGQILLNGIDVLGLHEAEMCNLRGDEIGMVFQEPMTALNPVHTIGRQVAETIRLHRSVTRAEANQIAAKTLERVGLPPDQFPPGRYPHELSGGQRQRVVIAMAIACQPRLLIADEPTTALDVTTQAKIIDLLRQLVREDGMGLLMITHDLALVAGLADRVVVMRTGEVIEQNSTTELLSNMRHPYTRMLFEASTHTVNLPAANTTRPLLEVQNVKRTYALPRTHLFAAARTFEAVRGVSFEIREGERLGLVGESGCGKSTLTRAILGLDAVEGGSILLNGEPVFSDGKPNLDVRRKMQVVFQDPYGSFNPRHTVSRLVTEPFHLLEDPPKGTDRKVIVAEILTAVGLSPGDANKYPHQFSGGQRQRIAIARALIIRPKLVIFDEAVSALDVSVRAQILDLIADLCRQYGLTYLFISHDLHVVRTVTDRVLVMQAGQIVEQGDTEKVLSDPQHSYTRALIDAAPRMPDLDAYRKDAAQ